MRSRKNHTISSRQVHEWTLKRLVQAKLLKDRDGRCKTTAVWNVVLRAACQLVSIFAACRDLADAPCEQSVLNSLHDGLPKTLPVLERRLNESLVADLPLRMKRRARRIAIDWHLVPYYGQPKNSRNELYYGMPKQGTSKFHAYATACITYHGERYTLALTWVRRHEKTTVALQRLIEQIRKLGLKIKHLLLDRAFFNVPVVAFLQREKLPFVMPVVIRGRTPKKGKKKKVTSGLRWIKKQKAGWYSHTLKNGKQQATLKVCLSYRTHRNRKDGKRVQNKLLFAAWGVSGSPVQIRELYRKRFGIEASYRQLRQARIYTCTRCPHLRLVFIAIALLLRNIWVWIHDTMLTEGTGPSRTLHLERLRFKRMLDWIARLVVSLFHDGSMPYVARGS
jgi:hypothetical protein